MKIFKTFSSVSTLALLITFCNVDSAQAIENKSREVDKVHIETIMKVNEFLDLEEYVSYNYVYDGDEAKEVIYSFPNKEDIQFFISDSSEEMTLEEKDIEFREIKSIIEPELKNIAYSKNDKLIYAGVIVLFSTLGAFLIVQSKYAF